jgi:large subunit ribosomal protein L30
LEYFVAFVKNLLFSEDFMRSLPDTKLLVTLRRSLRGVPERQRRILEALGLRRINQTVLHEDGPVTWGAVRKLIHLVELERVAAAEAAQRRRQKNGVPPTPHL